jgi:hypothetical protein
MPPQDELNRPIFPLKMPSTETPHPHMKHPKLTLLQCFRANHDEEIAGLGCFPVFPPIGRQQKFRHLIERVIFLYRGSFILQNLLHII